MKNAFFSLILIVSLLNFCHADQNMSIEQSQFGIPLVINEFMASNRETILDSQGQYDDWIEIYNYSYGVINIGGMYMTDDLETPTKWQIPAGTVVPSRGYLLIWADGDTSDSGLHADFKLSADGEQIGLFDTDGALIDSVTFSEQTTDISFGRYPDGSDNWLFLGSPTPETQNEEGYIGVVADTKFSTDRGFYDEPFTVEITTETAGASINYTTDGSTPTETYGQLYTGPIQISSTTCLRAMAYKTGWKSTNIDTHTYIFLGDAIQLSRQQALNKGYPDKWFEEYSADYEMDPEVYDNPDYADLMEDAMLSIPTISIVTDKDNLFSHEYDSETGGIYIYDGHSTTGGRDWERPVSVEFFSVDDEEEFQVNCGLKIQGGEGRRPDKCPKHSLRLVFKSKYGPPKLQYALFGDDAAPEFNTVTLRAGFCNSWHHWDTNQRNRAQYIRDTWAKDTQLDMGNIAGHGLFVHLYINGIYWGLYNPTERIDREFAKSYLGGEDTDYDVIKDYAEVVDGDNTAWNQMMSMANSGLGSNTNYQRIQGNNPDGTSNPDYEALVDVVNLIDYMIVNIYGGNTDWDHHNWAAVRSRINPGKGFQFLSWDAEHIMESINENTVNENNDNCPSALYHKLCENEDFRLLFADRIHLHFFNNGTLTPESVKERWMQRAEEIDLAVIAESARWGDYRRDVHSYSSGPYYLYTKNDFWIPERERLLDEYFPARTNVVLEQFRSNHLYPNVDAPVFNINGSYQHGGRAAQDSSFSITSEDGTIYYTIDGTDPRISGVSQQLGDAVAIFSETAPKRVLVPTRGISDNWKGGGSYSDIDWITGTGGVGYEASSGYEDYFNIDLYDQMYGRWTGCYIRIPFYVAQDVTQFGAVTLRIRYDDGFVAYINGTEVARRNFDGTPAWNSSADAIHTDSEAVNFEDIDISSCLYNIRSGSNTMAIHGLNASTTSTDFLISAELVAYEIIEDDSSLDSEIPSNIIEYTGPVTLTESTHIKARVLSGGIWSALNEATYSVGPVAESLRITEIMYHPQNDPNEEFIELANTGDQTINLNMVKFTNGIDFTFPSLELAPGGYVVVVQDITAFQDRYGTDVTVAGQYSGRLNNAGEKIELEDAAGQMILEFSYKDGWHPATDGDGFSLTHKELCDYGNDPDNWLAASPTPGR